MSATVLKRMTVRVYALSHFPLHRDKRCRVCHCSGIPYACSAPRRPLVFIRREGLAEQKPDNPIAKKKKAGQKSERNAPHNFEARIPDAHPSPNDDRCLQRFLRLHLRDATGI